MPTNLRDNAASRLYAGTVQGEVPAQRAAGRVRPHHYLIYSQLARARCRSNLCRASCKSLAVQLP